MAETAMSPLHWQATVSAAESQSSQSNIASQAATLNEWLILKWAWPSQPNLEPITLQRHSRSWESADTVIGTSLLYVSASLHALPQGLIPMLFSNNLYTTLCLRICFPGNPSLWQPFGGGITLINTSLNARREPVMAYSL